ncbi:fucolectin-3-like [Mercenaria mercenaria]|uniref:fucolectin-3-like n=1 Tax=Mercenaria mercenaria TaxID=6596 RepID=UPI00234E65C1|nr:fucolectin-3-like [Mercenaria mercenaria]
MHVVTTNKVIGHVLSSDRIIHGVDAWQMSTFIHHNGPLSANYAIDGNRDNNDQTNGHLYCAHTKSDNSFWGMEFERVADVSYVLLLFRNAMWMNERNSNLRLLISSTRQDSDNNVGTDCATFVGPPASLSQPTKVTCTQPVTGKFLKIIHNNPNPLTLCEVEVYST